MLKSKKVEILRPELRDKSIEIGWLKEDEQKTATWEIRLNGVTSARATVSILSTRGGVARREIEIR